MTEIRCPQCGQLIYETADGMEDNIEYTTDKCPYCDYVGPNPIEDPEEEQENEY